MEDNTLSQESEATTPVEQTTQESEATPETETPVASSDADEAIAEPEPEAEQPVVTSQDEVTDQPTVRRNGYKDEFKKKGDEVDQAAKPPMSKEETLKFYEENIPLMKLQDEYDELMFRFHERKVRQIELQVREVEAIGYLSNWKAGQDEAKRKAEYEAQMKEQWDKMSPEEQESYRQKAKLNMLNLDRQAKGLAPLTELPPEPGAEATEQVAQSAVPEPAVPVQHPTTEDTPTAQA